MGKPAKSFISVTVTIVAMVFGAGCAVSDSTLNAEDIVALVDTSVAMDVAEFPDDVVNGRDSATTDSTTGGDTYVATDSVVIQMDIAGGDEGSSDSTEPYTDVIADDPGGDVPFIDQDASPPVDATDSIRIPCPGGDIDCPDGFKCETDGKGGTFCMPPQECSLDGLTSIEDLVGELNTLEPGSHVFVKLLVPVAMGPRTCEMNSCTQEDPCCNKCRAGIIINEVPNFPIDVNGSLDVGSIECLGNNCAGTMECRPMVPGNSYIIWGTATMFQWPQISTKGFCDASSVLATVD